MVRKQGKAEEELMVRSSIPLHQKNVPGGLVVVPDTCTVRLQEEVLAVV